MPLSYWLVRQSNRFFRICRRLSITSIEDRLLIENSQSRSGLLGLTRIMSDWLHSLSIKNQFWTHYRISFLLAVILISPNKCYNIPWSLFVIKWDRPLQIQLHRMISRMIREEFSGRVTSGLSSPPLQHFILSRTLICTRPRDLLMNQLDLLKWEVPIVAGLRGRENRVGACLSCFPTNIPESERKSDSTRAGIHCSDLVLSYC